MVHLSSVQNVNATVHMIQPQTPAILLHVMQNAPPVRPLTIIARHVLLVIISLQMRISERISVHLDHLLTMTTHVLQTPRAPSSLNLTKYRTR